MATVLRATTAHRRARIARRHGLADEHRHDDLLTATRAMTALHATEPSTPHLSLLARVDGLTVADVERALYDERSVVKVMGMRRTLFVVDRGLVASIAGSVGARVADTNARRLSTEAAEQGLGLEWIAAARADLVAELTGREFTSRELRQRLDHLGGTLVAGPGTKWAAEVSTMSRLLTIFSADGTLVRAHNAGHWRISRPTWTTMASWLGESVEPTEVRAGYEALVRSWLRSFGPGTEADLVWWLGTTKGAVRTALSDVAAVEVALDSGSTAWVLPDDLDDLTRPPDASPWVALLPVLDPTTMGWRERDWYLDRAHVPSLFDRDGNGGTTIWVDGRIVGCWVQDRDGHVRPVLLEPVSADQRQAIDLEVARLDEFIGGERISNVFPSPEMRRASQAGNR
jgi:hypothetical protein